MSNVEPLDRFKSNQIKSNGALVFLCINPVVRLGIGRPPVSTRTTALENKPL